MGMKWALADSRHCPLPFSGSPSPILSPSRGRASNGPGLCVLQCHTRHSWKHLEQLLTEKEILNRRGHKPRAHLRGRATRLGCLGTLALPLSSLPRKVTYVRGTRSRKEHNSREWVGRMEGRKNRGGRVGVKPGVVGPSQPGRGFVLLFPVCCLWGPCRSWTPTSTLRKPNGKSRGCHGLSQDLGEQERTSEGQRAAGDSETQSTFLPASGKLENQSCGSTSCSAPPCQILPKAGSETKVAIPPRCPHHVDSGAQSRMHRHREAFDPLSGLPTKSSQLSATLCGCGCLELEA